MLRPGSPKRSTLIVFFFALGVGKSSHISCPRLVEVGS